MNFGKIHSVYNKTINISSSGRLLSLQSMGSPLSPISLETSCTPEELSTLNISHGTEVSATDSGLYINGCFFTYDFSALWNSELGSVIKSSSSRAQYPDTLFLQRCLRGILPVGGFSDLVLPDGHLWKQSASAAEAKKILVDCRTFISLRNWERAATSAASIIGLGDGLTPSGDDFLCGMLAASIMLSTPDALEFSLFLKNALYPQLCKTNDISAEFLRCAMDGHFGQAVIRLACGADEKSVIRSFAAIGHSSGADTLSGILFLTDALSSYEKGENLHGEKDPSL